MNHKKNYRPNKWTRIRRDESFAGVHRDPREQPSLAEELKWADWDEQLIEEYKQGLHPQPGEQVS